MVILDAFIGNKDGNTVFFQNTGTSAAPDFSRLVPSDSIPSGSAMLARDAAPDFADIDG